MIILFLIMAVFLFFFTSNLIVHDKEIHKLASITSLLFLIIAVGLTVGNFRYHTGMSKRTFYTKENVASITPKTNMLIYTKVGSDKKHTIVMYKANKHQHKIQHTGVDTNIINKIRYTNAKKPHIEKKIYKWGYKRPIDRQMFAIAHLPKSITTTNTFYVPKSWAVLSAQQAKVFKKTATQLAMQAKKQASQNKAMIQQQGAAYVQSKMMSIMQKKHVSLSKAKKTLEPKLEKQFKSHMKAKMERQIIQKALIQAKQTPVGYVK